MPQLVLFESLPYPLMVISVCSDVHSLVQEQPQFQTRLGGGLECLVESWQKRCDGASHWNWEKRSSHLAPELLNEPTLIIVPAIDLIDQLAANLTKALWARNRCTWRR